MRLAAWKEILDRGYGKPLATATVQETWKIEVIHRVIVDPEEPKVINGGTAEVIEHDELEERGSGPNATRNAIQTPNSEATP